MNTSLGISFWRVVNEEGSGRWIQVYAKHPFDDEELKVKGALFGVVEGGMNQEWAEKDAQLMSWLEDYFNGLEGAGDLQDFYIKWKNRYGDLGGVWVWVSWENGERKMRIVRSGETRVGLIREGNKIMISETLMEGKILKGAVKDGDRLVLAVGESVDEGFLRLTESDESESAKILEEIKGKNLAFGGVVIGFGGAETEKATEQQTTSEQEEVKEPTKDVPGDDGEEQIEEKTEELVSKAPYGGVKAGSLYQTVIGETKKVPDIAGETYVGPIGVKEKVMNWWMRLSDSRRSRVIEIGGQREKKKYAVVIGLVFLLLLTVSLVFGSIKKSREAELKKWKSFAEPIEKRLEEASSLSAINPSGAKKIIEDARVVFDTGKKQFEEKNQKDDLDSLAKRIDEVWTKVSGEKESTIEEILKIDLVRQNYKGERVGLLKDQQFYSLDTSMGVVVSFDTKTKDIKVVAGKGEGLGWLDTVGDGKKVMVMSSTGVRNAETGADLIRFDAAVARPVAMGRFGANLYILDGLNKEIYKYASNGETFGDRVRWLKTEQQVSIDPVDMAIDTDVWVVSEKGQVERFRRGVRENFSLSGLPSGVKVIRIAVQSEGSSLALLSSSSAAIFICSKESGVCNQTLKSGKLLEAKDVEYDALGSLYVVYGGVVGVVK